MHVVKPNTGGTTASLNENEQDFISELLSLSTFLEQQDSLEDSLKELAAMVSKLLQVENCSIMLIKGSSDSNPKLRVMAHHGFLPEEAYDNLVGMQEGISGQVASTGEPLLIAEIRHSPYAVSARRPVKSGDGGFISCPLMLAKQVIGVLNVSTPSDDRILDHTDLSMVSMVSLLIAKSIQVFQLQHLLNSNFIQLALARETQSSPQKAVIDIAQDGDRMAKILAQSFYKEMHSAGFGSDHIIAAATELISQINSSIKPKE